MKNSKICTKCNSSDITRIVGIGNGTGNCIIAKGVFNQVSLTRYLCCRCGYVEEWLDDLSKVEDIKKYQEKQK